jgi:YfiR/HmsC-like
MDKSLVNIKIALACTVAMATPLPGVGETPDTKTYKIKANYLYNLTKFVHWPRESNHSLNHTHICIYGAPQLFGYLEKLSASTTTQVSLNVGYSRQNNQLQQCHIVFLSNQFHNVAPIIESMNTLPILTVGENTDFLDLGGMISLVVKHENDIQLDINLTQAKKNGFAISGNLLEIAESIK